MMKTTIEELQNRASGLEQAARNEDDSIANLEGCIRDAQKRAEKYRAQASEYRAAAAILHNQSRTTGLFIDKLYPRGNDEDRAANSHAESAPSSRL